MGAEPIITCPGCNREIKLTESLAAPLIESTRQQYEKRLAQQNADVAKREQTIKAREAELAQEKESIEAAVAEKLKAEKTKIAADAKKREEALKAREEELAKEKEGVERAVAAKVKAERDKLAAEATKREQAFREREEQLRKDKEAMDATLAEKLKAERTRIAAEEAKKAKLVLGDDLEQKAKELGELQAILKLRDEKLAEAQKAQAELVRKQRELDDAKREMELTIETRVTESVAKTREQAKKEAEEKLALKVIEKDQLIEQLGRRIEDLQKKMEQGSVQAQGEALELQIESLLGSKFPHDRIDPVPKGEHGGDILQRVMTPTGTACGTILWETKRTKNWSDGWLAKLREDQRQAKAEISVIVSAVLPKGVESFDQIDSVWIVHPRCIVPVAMSLRQMLIEVNCARQLGEGQHTKMEMIYHYLTGNKFRLRVEAILEASDDMNTTLAKERKAIQAQWAKRQEQIDRVIGAMAGMYGELKGIAGKSLQEIDGLDVAALPEPVRAD